MTTHKYTTVEGHPIVVGERYETRGGEVYRISAIIEDFPYPIRAEKRTWTADGREYGKDDLGPHSGDEKWLVNDLMRPVGAKPVEQPAKPVEPTYD